MEPLEYKGYEPAFCRERHRLTELNICAKIARVDERLTARLDGMDKALEIKTRELDRRLEGLNELREEVIKDRDQYARREIFNSKVNYYDQWITTASEKLTRLMVDYETRINRAAVISIIARVVSVVAIFINFYKK